MRGVSYIFVLASLLPACTSIHGVGRVYGGHDRGRLDIQTSGEAHEYHIHALARVQEEHRYEHETRNLSYAELEYIGSAGFGPLAELQVEVHDGDSLLMPRLGVGYSHSPDKHNEFTADSAVTTDVIHPDIEGRVNANLKIGTLWELPVHAQAEGRTHWIDHAANIEHHLSNARVGIEVGESIRIGVWGEASFNGKWGGSGGLFFSVNARADYR